MPSSSDWRDRLVAELREELLGRHPGDEEGRMLHAPGFRTGGRYYVFVTADELVLKLPAPRVQELIAGGQGSPCSPRPGHPMREWVQLAVADAATALPLVLESRAFVAAQVPR
ncbi:hypothetical protein GC722_03445 [Auraticoccus sp. F435]|uniref:MmcQ/YjbR family DNA-binding protein n=1 Tax=Auraticoccus cholistanensis TaxID=2656650 RepID=A0A6A9UQB2_9ACTN|nr:hypothetical protein [Auraticoccus cholistanensis]